MQGVTRFDLPHPVFLSERTLPTATAEEVSSRAPMFEEFMHRPDEGMQELAEHAAGDRLAYDLSLSGCRAANASFSTNPNTYYLSLVTSMPAERPSLLGIPLPRLFGGMNLLLEGPASYQADVVDFVPGAFPLPNWGTTPELRIEAWRENDGAVSAISQRFPFTHHDEPFGREGIFDGAPIQKGKWHFERVEKIVGKRFDHLDPGFGAAMKRGVAATQRDLYQKVAALL